MLFFRVQLLHWVNGGIISQNDVDVKSLSKDIPTLFFQLSTWKSLFSQYKWVLQNSTVNPKHPLKNIYIYIWYLELWLVERHRHRVYFRGGWKEPHASKSHNIPVSFEYCGYSILNAFLRSFWVLIYYIYTYIHTRDSESIRHDILRVHEPLHFRSCNVG